jgi:hypothetical protein
MMQILPGTKTSIALPFRLEEEAGMVVTIAPPTAAREPPPRRST